MFVSNTKNTITEALNIRIGDANIKLPTSVEHLGRVLDKKLNFESHTSSLENLQAVNRMHYLG